jgi:hypothetical protein
MRVHDRHVPIRLPDRLKERVATFPETHMGVHTITATLHGGRVFSGVEVAWADEIIRVAGSGEIPFAADDIAEVDDASGLS